MLSRPGQWLLMCLVFVAATAAAAVAAQTGSAPRAASSGLVGTWQGPDGVVEIRADGTLSIGAVPYRYTVSGAVLTLIGSDGVLPIPFEFDGDRLGVLFNGQPVVLTRVTTASGRPPGADGSPAPGGGGGADIAGKWCYLSSFSANGGGGRMSDECFTVNTNGTYTYHRESSMSAYAPGAYGATASTTEDAGTWSLRGAALTVNSRSQGTTTYTLERRNHPKTGDPMLCLDGNCFVTYGPRPPWR